MDIYHTDINMQGNKVINLAIEKSASFPATPADGQIHIKSGLLYWYDADTSEWLSTPTPGAYQGGFDAGTETSMPAALTGDWWYITHEGDVGGILTEVVKAGDIIVADIDTPGNTEGNWTIIRIDREQEALWEKSGDTAVTPLAGRAVIATKVQALELESGEALFADNVSVDDSGIFRITDQGASGITAKKAYFLPDGQLINQENLTYYSVTITLLTPGGSVATGVSGIGILGGQTASIVDGVLTWPQVITGTFELLILPAGYAQITDSVTVSTGNITESKTLSAVWQPGEPSYDVTFELHKPAGGSPVPLSGQVTLFTPAGSVTKFFVPVSGEIYSSATFDNITNGTYDFICMPSPVHLWESITGTVTVSGEAKTKTLTATALSGAQIGDVIAGLQGELIDAGSESNFELDRPTSVVQVASNYDKVLLDPEDTKTVEFTTRKGADGGALTLQCNVQFMMDGVLGDVLTTTTQGAWIRVKSIEVDGTWRYVVIMDSGDWILDTP
jgi:hypothetical protein